MIVLFILLALCLVALVYLIIDTDDLRKRVNLLEEELEYRKAQLRTCSILAEQCKEVIGLLVQDVNQLMKGHKRLENEVQSLRWHVDNLNRLYNIYKPEPTLTDKPDMLNPSQVWYDTNTDPTDVKL